MKSTEISFSSNEELELINVTEPIQTEVKKAKFDDGLLHIFAPHATGVLFIAEDEGGLRQDILKFIKQTFPKGAGYRHDQIDDNAHSHLMSCFLGCDLRIPVRNGKIQLGTWQSIFFLETDGPRSGRRLILSFVE